jgi:hypothetical protein
MEIAKAITYSAKVGDLRFELDEYGDFYLWDGTSKMTSIESQHIEAIVEFIKSVEAYKNV